jgi:hypothetical protein
MSYPLWDTWREERKYMEAKKMNELESLEPAKLEWLFEIAANSRLLDCVDALKEQGIDVSPATLGRFLRKTREKRLVEDGAELAETAGTLSNRAETEVFRKGTLEAVRQRLFEQALESQTAEETRKLYSELLKEEAKLKELELGARRVALAEEEARLRRAELRRGRKQVELVENAEVKELGGGEIKEANLIGGPGAGNQNEVALEFLRRLAEVLNRGGSCEEKVLEARSVLSGAQGLLGVGDCFGM